MFIAFLRSINVGGRNIIKMKELIAEMMQEDFSDVNTYIQSGNVIFNSQEKDCDKISESIEALIYRKFNLNISAIVLKSEDLKKIIELNPFIKEDTKQIFVTLHKSKSIINDTNITSVDLSDDCFTIANNVFYIKCLNGYHKTKFNNAFFEKKFKVISTTRNIDTLIKVKELVGR